MDSIDRTIIKALQGNFPVCEQPYLPLAMQLGMDADTFLARLKKLLESGRVSRISPVLQIERLGGARSLAAMQVPKSDFERVTTVLNAMPEVAYTYERQHALNLWFVVATETPECIASTLANIEAATGHSVIHMPKERDYCAVTKAGP